MGGGDKFSFENLQNSMKAGGDIRLDNSPVTYGDANASYGTGYDPINLRRELAKARAILAANADDATFAEGDRAIAEIEQGSDDPQGSRGKVERALRTLQRLAVTVAGLGQATQAIEEIIKHF
jgi:hypothetical protein